jgi:hypothetical protein
MSRELVEDQTKINNQQKKPEGSQLPRLWHVLCKPLRDVAKKRDDAKVDNLNFFKHLIFVFRGLITKYFYRTYACLDTINPV